MKRIGKFSARSLVLLVGVLLVVGLACSGGQGGATVAPAPQQPVAAAQPAPAAAAAEPRAAPAAPNQPASATAPKSAPQAAAEGAKYGGIATIGVRQDAGGGWDIMKVTGWVDLHQMGAPVWGSGNLTKPCRDNVYNICPGLAESWQVSGDLTQWTFKIRDNVLWHDGARFSADDAKFWLELAQFGAKTGDKVRRPAWFQGDLGNPKKVEALEGNRLRVTLAQPERLFPDIIGRTHLHLAHPRHVMVPRIEKGEMDVSPQDIGWVGTGPFKVQKHEKGARLEVRRFDKYWEKDAQGRQLPYMDGVDFAIIRDPAAFDAAFRVGRLEGGAPAAGHALSIERQAGYLRDLGDKVWFTEAPSSSGASILGFNILKPGIQQDVRVRKAISLGIDRTGVIPVYFGGFGVVSSVLNPRNPFSPTDFLTWPGWNPATRAQDRAEAKRLLAEAGYARGAKITHNCWTTWLNLCQYLKAQFADIGIDLELAIVDQLGRTRGLTNLEFDTIVGNAPRTPFPEGLQRLLGPFSFSPASTGKHEDPKVTQYFAQLSGASSLDQRVKVWREMERYMVVEQVYIVPLASGSQVVPYRSYLKGFPVPAEDLQNNLDHATVWLDK
jgi:peptide/nickel transport system substrate-binding protein